MSFQRPVRTDAVGQTSWGDFSCKGAEDVMLKLEVLNLPPVSTSRLAHLFTRLGVDGNFPALPNLAFKVAELASSGLGHLLPTRLWSDWSSDLDAMMKGAKPDGPQGQPVKGFRPVAVPMSRTNVLADQFGKYPVPACLLESYRFIGGGAHEAADRLKVILLGICARNPQVTPELKRPADEIRLALDPNNLRHEKFLTLQHLKGSPQEWLLLLYHWNETNSAPDERAGERDAPEARVFVREMRRLSEKLLQLNSLPASTLSWQATPDLDEGVFELIPPSEISRTDFLGEALEQPRILRIDDQRSYVSEGVDELYAARSRAWLSAQANPSPWGQRALNPVELSMLRDSLHVARDEDMDPLGALLLAIQLATGMSITSAITEISRNHGGALNLDAQTYSRRIPVPPSAYVPSDGLKTLLPPHLPHVELPLPRLVRDLWAMSNKKWGRPNQDVPQLSAAAERCLQGIGGGMGRRLTTHMVQYTLGRQIHLMSGDAVLAFLLTADGEQAPPVGAYYAAYPIETVRSVHGAALSEIFGS